MGVIYKNGNSSLEIFKERNYILCKYRETEGNFSYNAEFKTDNNYNFISELTEEESYELAFRSNESETTCYYGELAEKIYNKVKTYL